MPDRKNEPPYDWRRENVLKIVTTPEPQESREERKPPLLWLVVDSCVFVLGIALWGLALYLILGAAL